MESFTQLVAAIATLLWPAIVIVALYYLRDHVRLLLDALRVQFASGAALKWGEFELRGMNLLSFDDKRGDAVRVEQADKELFDTRHENYRTTKNLFLVHRARPTGRLSQRNGLPMYDIMIYLVPHKGYGRINDVKEVEYYLGQYFGRERGAHGTKYIVQNGSEGFAVRLDASGPSLCEARIKFHDGSETTVSRYLDFECTGYLFNSTVIESDQSGVVAASGSPSAKAEN